MEARRRITGWRIRRSLRQLVMLMNVRLMPIRWIGILIHANSRSFIRDVDLYVFPILYVAKALIVWTNIPIIPIRTKWAETYTASSAGNPCLTHLKFDIFTEVK